MPNTADRPNRIPWPPLILVAALVAGTGLEHVLDTSLGPLPPFAGGLLVAAALALDLWAMLTMANAGTNILPHRAAGRLVAAGPFAFTRNPIYLGNALLLAGLGIAFDSAWLLGAAAVDAVLTHHAAILREESHLEHRFGTDWTAYAVRVPRWIGLPRR